MVDPPLLEGGLKAMVTEALPGVAEVMEGAPGTASGVTGLELVEGVLLPAELMAETLKT